MRPPAFAVWMSCDTLSRPGAPSPIGFRGVAVGKREIKYPSFNPMEHAFRLKFGPNPAYWMVYMKRGGKRFNNYIAKLSKTITDNRSKFYIDKRTHTIRPANNPRICLGN